MPGDDGGRHRADPRARLHDIITYAPAPFEEVEDAVDPKPSGVRLYTLIGGLAGVVTGYA